MLFSVGEGNDTPLQYSCLENPMDGGAWQAAVHGVAKSRTRLSNFPFTSHFSCIGEGNGDPLQCSCLENPKDGGAWWASVYGVAQSRTRLKQLSSSTVLGYCKNRFRLKGVLVSLVCVSIPGTQTNVEGEDFPPFAPTPTPAPHSVSEFQAFE